MGVVRAVAFVAVLIICGKWFLEAYVAWDAAMLIFARKQHEAFCAQNGKEC
jgi:hypothetical protein